MDYIDRIADLGACARQSETSVRDLAWAAAHTGSSGRRLVVAWAADCAERVLPVWKAHHPTDSRPRDAIALVRRWLADPATVTQRELRAAAYAAAAYAAADAERAWQRARLLQYLAGEVSP